MTKTFAVWDDKAIWGVGKTGAEAWADVAQWINPEDYERAQETMTCSPMTKFLAHRVNHSGGNIPFGEYQGTLMTRTAYERLYIGR